MLLWVALACLTAAVVVALVHPMSAQGGAGDGARAELDIYRDQLAELETEKARGLVGEAEAEAARIEVSRRLLAAAGREPAMASAGTAEAAAAMPAAWPPQLRLAAIVTALALPGLSLALYLAQGSPWMPDQPAAVRAVEVERQRTAKASEVERLLGLVEAELKAHPDDGNRWEGIAPIYMRMQRYKESADAFANAIRLLGPSARRLAGFAEATVFAAKGVVTEPARKAFEELTRLDPERPEPKFWLALAKEQAGDVATARLEYQGLLASAPADAPWRPLVAERIAEIDAKSKDGTKGGAAPGEASRPRQLGAEEIAAADKMAPDARRGMIDGMVKGLALRLEKNGRDPDGWLRLIRAYAVLGEMERAKEALVSARRSLTDDKAALEALASLARSLGLES